MQAEFLQSQVEASTRICPTVRQVREEVWRMRQQASIIAASLGLTLVAAGTHPFSQWTMQQVTRGDRYAILAEELQEVGRRLVTFGLHVHVGIADPDRRVQALNRIRPYLSLLLALSTSSPFFAGRFTGLRSYRSALIAALPRSGIPPCFATWADYQDVISTLTGEGLLANPSFIWWDARLSSRFPTLEIRIADMPARVEDTVCLAAWAQSLVVRLLQEPPRKALSPLILESNKWQAARYGLEARLILDAEGPARPVREWVNRLVEQLSDTARELDCLPELAHARTILDRGTSADEQLQIWHETNDLGAVIQALSKIDPPT